MHQINPPESPPDRVIVLGRQSKRQENRHGTLSQIDATIDWCYEQGWGKDKIITVAEEGSGWKETPIRDSNGDITGYRTDRPKFREVIRQLRDYYKGTGKSIGFAIITCDRGMRNNADLKELEDLVRASCPSKYAPPLIQCWSVDGTFDLRTGEGISATYSNVANARQQSAATSTRINARFRQRARQGIHYGNGRRGYKWCEPGTRDEPCQYCNGGRLRIIEDEAEKIRIGARGVLAGKTWTEIMDEIQETPGWDGTGLRDALLSPVTAGLSFHQGNYECKGLWEPILDEDEWARVCDVLRSEDRRFNQPGGRRVSQLGSALFRCSMPGCDGTMGSQVYRKGESKAASYSCQVCHGQRRLVSVVDRVVGESIAKRLARSDAKDLLPERTPDHSREIADLREEIAKIDEDISNVLALLATPGALTREQAASKTVPLNRDRKAKLKRLAELSQPEANTDPEGIFGNPDAARIWDGLTPQRKREIIEMIAVVWVGPVTRRAHLQKGILPDEENITPVFREKDGTFPDRPENKPRISEESLVRDILVRMYAERDTWTIAEVTARVAEEGLTVGHRIIQNARRDLGIALRRAESGWVWTANEAVGKPLNTAPRICEQCGGEFQPSWVNQRFCGTECWEAADSARKAANAHECACGCGATVASRRHIYASRSCWVRSRTRNAASGIPSQGTVDDRRTLPRDSWRFTCVCIQCGEEFGGTRKAQKWCSSACYKDYRKAGQSQK